MTEDLTLLTPLWYQGIDALLKGDDALAEEIWMGACQVDEVAQRTGQLVMVLEGTVIELLQGGNFAGAKKCYEMLFEVDATFENPTLDKVLRWRERYTEDCGKKDYRFTVDWFSNNIPIWNQVLRRFVGSPDLRFLEVGSWEGRSTCWLLDNILLDSSSTITCIDTFQGSIENDGMGLEEHIKSLEAIFDHNVHQTGREKQVIKMVGTSRDCLRQLPPNSFDMYYVDGSHIAADVLEDIILGWRLLKEGAIIIFDDYEWGAYRDQPTLQPKLAVDAFLAVFQDRVKILHKGYQVICEKVEQYGGDQSVQTELP